MTSTLTLATLVTPNFKFDVLAADKPEAERLLEAAWSRHFDEYRRADMLSWDALMDEVEQPASRFSLEFREMVSGSAYRDRQVLVERVAS